MTRLTSKDKEFGIEKVEKTHRYVYKKNPYGRFKRRWERKICNTKEKTF